MLTLSDHNPYVGIQRTVFEQGWRRGRKDLLPIVDVLYGGVEHSDDDDNSTVLRSIADWLDRVDDATEKVMESLGGKHKVGRTIQADLRAIAKAFTHA